MYKRTPPQQKLFGVETQITPSLRGRLESSWAHLFKCEVLPILFRNEDHYAMLYGKTGRPNFSVAIYSGNYLHLRHLFPHIDLLLDSPTTKQFSRNCDQISREKDRKVKPEDDHSLCLWQDSLGWWMRKLVKNKFFCVRARLRANVPAKRTSLGHANIIDYPTNFN